MIVRAVPSAKRRDFSIAMVAFCSSACTSMLGIDGDYSAGAAPDTDTGLASGGQGTGTGGLHSMITPPVGSGGATHFDAGAAARGAGPNAGGAQPMPASGGAMPVGAGGSDVSPSASGGAPSAGGVPSSGGSPGIETGGAGGVPPDIDAGAPGCPTGTYTGSYRGTHKTALSILNSPIAGDVILRFPSSVEGSATVTGSLLDPLTDTTGGVGALLRGTFDCARGTGSVTTITAEVTLVVPLPYVSTVEGTVEIKMGKTGDLSGGFTIRETGNSMGTGTGTGTGTWTASH